MQRIRRWESGKSPTPNRERQTQSCWTTLDYARLRQTLPNAMPGHGDEMGIRSWRGFVLHLHRPSTDNKLLPLCSTRHNRRLTIKSRRRRRKWHLSGGLLTIYGLLHSSIVDSYKSTHFFSPRLRIFTTVSNSA